MPTTKLSVQGSSLKLLRSGERGIVTRINALRDSTAQTLRKIGLAPGQTITLEQRFPHFTIRVGGNCYSLDDAAMNAISIRIVER
ncbi:MAG: ferrous iron transport protein A [Pegethrix bostrychoides GSE-TBD4-15B]|jgi:Fe2+ transport system protein FeoA|uniref:Ferrous iron transport protein A n=1 Tax=Pegethrix bostrychoides GSE-TBD4-15B TaxID=2839662 RepID=A0A951PEY3_9CYAN|nr:ferrous iron transport protein A [Pegethrix bostrychoides GSE-TBD4-15B]